MNKRNIPVATPLVGEEEAAAAREVLLSGNYVSGPIVKDFEAEFAEYIGVKHAVALSSGTAALFIALEAAGVGKGDEVIVPPMTFFATVSSVLYVGAKPVFADISIDDLNILPEDVESKITSKTKAIIPVHLFGMPARMAELRAIADKHNLFLLEDCAQAHGSAIDGKKVGGLGDAGAFSFFATKHMTTGEGGMITTNDEGIAQQARTLRSHGMEGRDDHVVLGYNNRMTEIEAAIGRVQLKKLDDFNSRRIANSVRLLDRIREFDWSSVPVPQDKTITHTYFWCPVMVRAESGRTIEELKTHLQQSGIGFRHRYQKPLYHQPVLKNMGLDYSDVHLPNAENLAGKFIGLPNHPGLESADVDYIISVLEKF